MEHSTMYFLITQLLYICSFVSLTWNPRCLIATYLSMPSSNDTFPKNIHRHIPLLPQCNYSLPWKWAPIGTGTFSWHLLLSALGYLCILDYQTFYFIFWVPIMCLAESYKQMFGGKMVNYILRQTLRQGRMGLSRGQAVQGWMQGEVWTGDKKWNYSIHGCRNSRREAMPQGGTVKFSQESWQEEKMWARFLLHKSSFAAVAFLKL